MPNFNSNWFVLLTSSSLPDLIASSHLSSSLEVPLSLPFFFFLDDEAFGGVLDDEPGIDLRESDDDFIVWAFSRSAAEVAGISRPFTLILYGLSTPSSYDTSIDDSLSYSFSNFLFLCFLCLCLLCFFCGGVSINYHFINILNRLVMSTKQRLDYLPITISSSVVLCSRCLRTIFD